MSDSVRVTVPATAASLGPGFDALGLAVELRNEVIFRASGGFRRSADAQITVAIEGEGVGSLSSTSSNLVVRAAWKVFQQAERWPARLEIRLLNRIPLSSGMGSSAAATIGGLVAANEVAGGKLSAEQILSLAVEMEGHPDNVAPALYGGLAICVADEKGDVQVLRPRVRTDLTYLFCVPERGLPTRKARKALPKRYSREDVVFTISRVALLTTLLQSGDAGMLRLAMQDRIHQPYRNKLVPGLLAAVEAAQEAGAAGACFSGSGPSILAIVARNGSQEKISAAMRNSFARHGLASRSFALRLSRSGANVTGA